nr:restriction endonuclease subunit S [uncultured Acetatifactor sp.]
MMAGWREYTVADVISAVIDYRGKTPKKLGGEWSDSGYRALSAKNIKMGKIVQLDSIRYVSEEMYRCWMKEEVQKEDILITSEAPFGQIYYWDSDEKIVLSQRLFAVRINELFYPKYIYFYMTSSFFQAELDGRATGTTVVGLRQPELLKCKIFAPEYQEQKRIADILWCLERKVNNNEAINDNLQQQAFALFDQLMLDANGSKCPVSEIAYLNPKRPLSKNQVARYIDMSQLSTSGAFPSGWEMKPFNGGMRFTNGDTILARITPCLENGKTAYINFLDDKEIAFGSTEYIVLSPKENVPPEYLYCLARYPSFVDYAVKNMNGSSGRQRVSADTIGQFIINCPNKDALMNFGNVAFALFMKMRSNSLENIRLASLRDALLPKLISGEIDVSSLDI